MLRYKRVKTDFQIVQFYKYLFPIEDVILPPMKMFRWECRNGFGLVCTLNEQIIGGILAYPVEEGWMEIDQLHVDKEFRDGQIFRKFYLKMYLVHKTKSLRVRAKITNKGMIEKLGHILVPLPEKGDNWWEIIPDRRQ